MPFSIINSRFYNEDGSLLLVQEIEDKYQYDNMFDFFTSQEIPFPADARIIFHGGADPVVFPSAYKNDPRKKRDFGDGFYTTDDVDQANRWALRKLQEIGRGAVSAYEYTNDLGGLIFPEEPTSEWLDFVAQCRTTKCRHTEYDIIEGPVADDDVAPTIKRYLSGELSKIQTLEQLAYYESSHQLTFTNDNATQHLQFLGWWDVR